MRRPDAILTAILAAITSFVLGVVIASSLSPSSVRSSEPRGSFFPDSGAARPLLATAPMVNFADIVERVNPAVVNVTATGREKLADRTGRFFGNPMAPFGAPDPHEGMEVPRRGSGSAFFIDRAGYLLTNDHVIDGAERVEVTLFGGASLRAEVIGRDRATDLALLRVEESGDYPAIPLGDSDALRVGEWVCAIGNPLMLYDHTVTVGVVSFKGRTLFNPSFDNYIQTDAAINSGNSGGPLINVYGEVVGVNTAVSQQGQGIGFAVPINTAKDILEQLREKGSVSRGYLGVTLEDADDVYRKELGIGETGGAVVVRVLPGGAAERAGVKRYDVIVAVGDREVRSGGDLVKAVSSLAPGSSIMLTVIRDGEPRELVATLDARGSVEAALLEPPSVKRPPPSTPSPEDRAGLTLEILTDAARRRWELPDDATGLLVGSVGALSPAADGGIRVGDLVAEVNRRPVGSLDDYRRMLSGASPGDVLLYYIVRGGNTYFVAKVRL
jgi:serine protease Do